MLKNIPIIFRKNFMQKIGKKEDLDSVFFLEGQPHPEPQP